MIVFADVQGRLIEQISVAQLASSAPAVTFRKPTKWQYWTCDTANALRVYISQERSLLSFAGTLETVTWEQQLLIIPNAAFSNWTAHKVEEQERQKDRQYVSLKENQLRDRSESVNHFLSKGFLRMKTKRLDRIPPSTMNMNYEQRDYEGIPCFSRGF